MTPDAHTVALPAGRFGYLDVGEGVPVLALHGHFGRASIFAPLGDALGCRLLALDQRGHGHSPKGVAFGVDAYVSDAAAFLHALGVAPVVVLGHSMGGVVAFRLAARHPELVRALVVEDAGAVSDAPVVPQPVLDVRGWPHRAGTRDALARGIAELGVPPEYFLHSAHRFPDGWGLLFDYDDMMRSQHAHLGDYWHDWLASDCPALLLHGHASTVLPTALAREMAARRPNTTLREFPSCGHWLHDDDPAGFAGEVRAFLDQTETIRPGAR